MSIDLTAAYAGGDDAGGASYPEAKIVEFRMGLEHNKRVELFIEYGETVNGVWRKGAAKTVHVDIRDNPRKNIADYTDFVADNIALVGQVAAVLYAKAQEIEPRLAGTYTP